MESTERLDESKLLVDGDQDHLPALTVGMYRAFLAKGKRGIEALQVYLHLLFTYRLQKTDCVYALNSYIQQGIHMGEHRVKAAKSLLRSMRLIEAVRTRENGRIVQQFTRLNLLPNPGPTIGAESAPPVTIGAVTTRVENNPGGSGPQMLEEEIEMLEEKTNSSAAAAAQGGNGKEAKKRGEPDSRIPPLSKHYCEAFKARTGNPSTASAGWMAKQFKLWLKVHDPETITAVMDMFFDYPKRTCFAFNKLVNAFDNLIGRVRHGAPVSGGGRDRL